MDWLWGFLWIGLAVSAFLVVKRAGWPSANEERMNFVAKIVADDFVKTCADADVEPMGEEERQSMHAALFKSAKAAIWVYVSTSRRWW